MKQYLKGIAPTIMTNLIYRRRAEVKMHQQGLKQKVMKQKSAEFPEKLQRLSDRFAPVVV